MSSLEVSWLEVALDTPNRPGRAVRRVGIGFGLERVCKR